MLKLRHHFSLFFSARICASTMAMLAAMLFLAPISASAAYQDALKMVAEGKWDQALNEFEPLAAIGHAPSQFSIGLIYQLGRGVPKDPEKARKMYVMAAKQGFWPAYNNLGKMFLDGEGVPKSLITAFNLFAKAAENHAQAKNNLARMYENGWGTKQDVDKAIKLYEESGDSGYVVSHFRLGQMFEDGINVEKDKEAAIKWYTKASEKNHQGAVNKLKQLGG